MSGSPFATADLFDRPAPSPMPQASVRNMRRSSGIDRKVSVLDRKVGVLLPQTFGGRVAAFLRWLHPDKTAANVEADSILGREVTIDAATVSKWLDGSASPSGPNYQRLIEMYGAQLVVAVSPEASPATLQDAARLERQARLEREAARIQAEIAGLWSAP